MARVALGAGLAGVVAVAGWRRGALTADGAAAAVAVGTPVFAVGGGRWAAVLVGFFTLSSALSQVGRERKAPMAAVASKGSRRDAGQVLANGGVAAGAAVVAGITGKPEVAFPAYLGAMAAATSDTWATEIGMLSRRPPRSIVTLRRVRPGMSGGVTPLGLAAAAGLAVARLWDGGGERARYGLAAPVAEEPSGWGEALLAALRAAAEGVAQLALIVFPVMLLIQALKDLGALDRFAALMRPLMRPLGIAPRGAVTVAGGLVFGLAFGAGIILEQAREQRFSRREITLIALFLCACHAVIEDTLIFVPLGIDVLPLLVIRLLSAIALVFLIARLWPEVERGEEHDERSPG